MAREQLLKVSLVGDEQLQRVLRDLGSDQELTAVLKPALIAAAQPVMVALAAAAPRSSGGDARRRRARGMIPLHQTMGISFKKSGGRNTNSTAVMRVRIGPKYPDGAQAHLTEFGTVQRFAAGDKRIKNLSRLAHASAGGLNRGAVQGQHWMLRTWNRMIGATLENLQNNIQQQILRRGAYLNKKYGEGK